MTTNDLDNGNALNKQINAITAAQAAIAAAGSKAAVSMLSDKDETTLTPENLKVALGDDYDTLVAGVKTDLNDALTAAKTAAQTAFAALGGAA